MTEYKTKRIIDKKPPPRWVVVNETGKIVNKNPSESKLKGLGKELRKAQDTRNFEKYTDKELLDYLIQFYEEHGGVPVQTDFVNNPGYPSFATYQKRFGSWNNALKLVGLDVDSMTKKGVLITNQQKARLAEIKVINHFRQRPIDLAGENCRSPCDGICPNGKTYDVKSSGSRNGTYYQFATNNKYKEEIEIYYFLAFNEDWTEPKYVWRVPGEIVEKDIFYVGTCRACCSKFNIENMKEYDITDKFKEFQNDS